MSKVLMGILGGALGGMLTVCGIIFASGAWKGAVDEQLKSLATSVTLMQQQMDRMDGKIDRLSETVQNRK